MAVIGLKLLRTAVRTAMEAISSAAFSVKRTPMLIGTSLTGPCTVSLVLPLRRARASTRLPARAQQSASRGLEALAVAFPYCVQVLSQYEYTVLVQYSSMICVSRVYQYDIREYVRMYSKPGRYTRRYSTVAGER